MSVKSPSEQVTNGTSESVQKVKEAPMPKTPLSLLFELVVKHKEEAKPEYDVKIDTEAKMYTVTLKLGAQHGTGTAKSKQRARQLAALQVLETLVLERGWEVFPGLQSHLAVEYVRSLLPDEVENAKEENGGTTKKSHPTGPSPVSLLEEKCMREGWPKPQYKMLSQEDPAVGKKHGRVAMSVSIGRFEQKGSAGGPKSAKADVALKMLEFLRGNPNPEDMKDMKMDDAVQKDVMRCLQTLTAMRESKANDIQPAVAMKIAEALKKTRGRGHTSPAGDQNVRLQKVADKVGFQIKHVESNSPVGPGGDQDASCQCLVQMLLAPTAVTFGVGKTPEAARNAAAMAGLEYLRHVSGQYASEE